MATTILPGTVVLEVLRGEENYENWSDCIKNYLLAQDLWDIIETSMEPPKPEDDDLEVDFKAWRKKNAATLHAIQISCGMNILSEIKGNISSAKVLWDTLAKRYEHPAQEGGDNLRLPAAGGTTGFSEYEKLYEAVRKGYWDVASDFITQHPDSVRAKITHLGQTALHVAVLARHVDIVKTLVEEKMSKEDLEIRDNEGLTALDLTIICGYKWRILECMITKNGELVTVGNDRGLDIPIVLALRHEQTELANYLYDKTPFELLLPQRGPHGATVVTKAIHTGNYGLAMKLIQKCSLLALTLDTDNASPISVMFGTTSLLGRERLLDQPESNWSRLREMIYYGLGISSPSHANPFQYYLDNRKELERRKLEGRDIIRSGPQRSTDRETGIQSIKDEYVSLLIAVIGSIWIMVKNDKIGVESGVELTIFSAVRTGMVDFIHIIMVENTELLYWVRDGKRRNVLMSAVQHRQAKIFGMIYGLKETKARLLSSRDNLGNNILHVAGMLTEFSPLDHITGAALKMQTEVQWFQGVENLCNPMYKNERNYAGLTPKQVFMQTHRKLMKEGEQWMKDTASSCTVVGALIVTIMFAAVFTVPGGNDQNTGFPIFLNKKLFKTFIIANSLSLFSSSTSVLMFLGILTSRYETKDFLRSLPTKMIVGLFTLFFSVATMMIAFSSAILIMFSGESWILIPLIGLASIPVCLYVFMQLPLLYDMIVSTYGSGTFDQKMKFGARHFQHLLRQCWRRWWRWSS